jgi:molybdopterin-guanine dinucleotide biosynthesis protein A
MMRQSELCAFVLAGGKSTRMGRDKALLTIDGRTLLEHALDKAAKVARQVVIVGSRDKYGTFGTVVEDLHPGCGPLAGIEAALKSSNSELNLLLAVDLPFVSVSLLQYLIQQAEASCAVVTLPFVEGKYETLCAVYRREFAARAEQALAAGLYMIRPLFREVAIRLLDEQELADHGFSPADFANLNTAEELQRARGRN